MAKKPPTLKSVETLKHDADKRKNIPTAEHQSVIQKEQEFAGRFLVPLDALRREFDAAIRFAAKNGMPREQLQSDAHMQYLAKTPHGQRTAPCGTH